MSRLENRWTNPAGQIKALNGLSGFDFFLTLHFRSHMARSKLISSTSGSRKKRARVARPRGPLTTAPPLEPGAPTDFELMKGIQARDPDALSQLYDRYSGILKALILRVIINEADAGYLLQEVFMGIWIHAKNFSAQKGKPLGWMVTLGPRRAIDGLRKKQAYMRAEERLQSETEQQPGACVHNVTEDQIARGDRRILVRNVINQFPPPQQEVVELAFFRG